MQRVTDHAIIGFLRALRANFANFRGAFRIEEVASTPWASVTFSGARHRVALILEGEAAAAAADTFLAGMEDAEFDLPGHILADIALAGLERRDEGNCVRLTLEALTVEDG
jgi:hypothetical protein